jgi:UDPglucose 6-dehydrogenase
MERHLTAPCARGNAVKIAVIGVGHVGLVTAACFAQWGHDVVGVDSDAHKIESLEAGRVPFHEAHLDELVAEGLLAGRLRFTTSIPNALVDCEAAFVCVGTPSRPGGQPDLSYVEEVGRQVAVAATGPLLLVEKSTVPVNTGDRLRQVIEREQWRLAAPSQVYIASNPEFLREGRAVHDTQHPDRIVYGTYSSEARDVLRRVYKVVINRERCPVVETDVPTAELIKHASNAFLATKISFINAVSQVCDRVGADVEVVAEGMGHDKRIGRHFLHAGLGYGGSCFPKDVDGFLHLSRDVGYDFALLEEVSRINTGQRRHVIGLLQRELWHLADKTVALLGAAYKPGTDDLRESPAVHLARELLALGARVRVYDPVALGNLSKELPEAELVDDAVSALNGAHAAVVTTEWDEILELRASDFLDNLAYPVVIDGRNALDAASLVAVGVRYHGIGRAAPPPK